MSGKDFGQETMVRYIRIDGTEAQVRKVINSILPKLASAGVRVRALPPADQWSAQLEASSPLGPIADLQELLELAPPGVPEFAELRTIVDLRQALR